MTRKDRLKEAIIERGTVIIDKETGGIILIWTKDKRVPKNGNKSNH